MTTKEILTKKFKMVDMGEIAISTEEKPIIGTQNLAPCLGILIYNEKKKEALVAHISAQPYEAKNIFLETTNLIYKSRMENGALKYKIIEGAIPSEYETQKALERLYSADPVFTPFVKEKIPDGAIATCDNTHQFAFDASTGRFVTDKVLFGLDYQRVNQEEKQTDNQKILSYKMKD